MKPTLSILIAAHREGRIAHKTMQSLLRATKKLDEANVPYEVIATIDNGDEITRDYFSRYEAHPLISVHHIQFADLALSRNYGVSLAKGDIIATLDADDLVSENWFIESVKTLSSTQNPVVFHTHYSVNFGTQNIVWEKFDSKSKEEDALIMTWANRWDSAVIAPREVFEKYPYQPNTEGYGSEDWHFNSQTLAAGIPHKVVPETILFVRRKDVSLMTQQAASRRTVRYTDLLDIEFMKTIDTQSFQHNIALSDSHISGYRTLLNRAQHTTKRRLKSIHRRAKKSELYRTTTHGIIQQLKKYNSDEITFNRFPRWLINEWRAIHAIEKELFPSQHLLEKIELYHSEMYELGVIFAKLCKFVTKTPDYIFFVPTLGKGGAELVTLRYVTTLKQLHPDWQIAVVATENGQHAWSDRLPSGVDFIQFGDLTQGLSETLRLQLLARFIVQLKTNRLHIAQSPLMFKFAALYQDFLAPNTVYAFGFCEDTDNEGRVAGHIHSGLPYAYDAVDKIITDNATVIQQLSDEYAYPSEKFVTHYQPIETPIKKPSVRTENNTTFTILWASRIAKQKRPDLLKEIARQLPLGITIDMYGSFQNGYAEQDFSSIESLRYCGTFDGIESLPTETYDAFLYTSENDGVPNILLEITAKGLPVIASNAGGIAEFIEPATGKLVENIDDIQAYVDAIMSLAKSTELRTGLVNTAQSKLTKQHSMDLFIESVNKDII